MLSTQQAEAEVVAQQHQREAERKRLQAEADVVAPPAIKPSAYYTSRQLPKSQIDRDVESGKILERGFDGRLEDGAGADPDDWLASLRAESAALPPSAQPKKAGRRGGSSAVKSVASPRGRRKGEELGLLGPGPSVIESDGTWSPPPSPPRRHRSARPRAADASDEGAGGNKRAPATPRKAVSGVSQAAHAIVSSSPSLPPAGRGRCNSEAIGKGLSNDILAMLEEVRSEKYE
jgi:hypothetical protein